MIPIEEKSKTKLLMILDILNKESDEENILTINDIIEKLKESGIDVERKSVIRDIKYLSEMGYDISLYNENRKGYFMRSRDFDINELRLIVDAILSAKFITQKKTKELVKKVECLTSKYQAKKLQKNFYMNQMIKSENE